MDRPHCHSSSTTERKGRTVHGLRRFRCQECGRRFNERTGTVLNLNVAKGSFLGRCLRCLCPQQSGGLLVLDPDLVQLGPKLFVFFKRSLE
jgi:hypothetical protein